jgi:diguanylate cyclase (GGDEF)-like protein
MNIVPESGLSNIEANKNINILVVDDEVAITELIKDILAEKDFNVMAVNSGPEAAPILEEFSIAVAVIDLKMQPETGVEVIRKIKLFDPMIEIIVITGYPSLEDTIKSIRENIFEYITKPFDNDSFVSIVSHAVTKWKLTRLNLRLMDMLKEQNVHLEERVQEVTQELRELSVRDALTNLYNFRHFVDQINKELTRAMRYKRVLSILMFDIDHFKQFNDANGHSIGNLALIELAKILKNTTRRVDTVCRYGGEEFVVILPETETSRAVILAERCRTEVEYSSFAFDPAQKITKLTVSVGVASFPSHAEEVDSIVKCADDALYKAKSLGRNKVKIFSPEPPLIDL